MAGESIESFLEKIGLEAEIDRFRNEDIDINILQKMTIDDLKEIGLNFGKRVKILDALKNEGMYLYL